jgi:hypothetical protein
MILPASEAKEPRLDQPEWMAMRRFALKETCLAFTLSLFVCSVISCIVFKETVLFGAFSAVVTAIGSFFLYRDSLFGTSFLGDLLLMISLVNTILLVYEMAMLGYRNKFGDYFDLTKMMRVVTQLAMVSS